MISLSVYGDPGNARYAAVWVQRPGPGWVAVHGVDSAGYQSFFNNSTAKGYVPVLVSATGTSSNAIFAAVFEQGIAGAWRARHGMTSGPEANAGTFQNLNKTAKDQKMNRGAGGLGAAEQGVREAHFRKVRRILGFFCKSERIVRGTDEVAYRYDPLVDADIEYETQMFVPGQDQAAGSPPGPVYVMRASVLDAVVVTGAAGQAAIRRTGNARYRGMSLAA